MENTPTPPGNERFVPPPESPKHSFGPAAGIIIIIAILIIGALYFWGQRLSNQSNLPSSENPSLENVSSSDEVDVIEEDLNAEPLGEEDLGEEDLNALEAELDAEIEAMEAEYAQ